MRRRSLLVATGATLATLATAGCSVEDPPAEGGGDDAGSDGVEASGEIEIVVDGEPVDLSADRYQAEYADESLAFHLHEGDDKWYMEGDERVTAGAAIGHLPHFAYERVEGDDVIAHDDESYDGSDPGTEIAFIVDGEPVDPTSYRLQDGDSLRVEITTDA